MALACRLPITSIWLLQIKTHRNDEFGNQWYTYVLQYPATQTAAGARPGASTSSCFDPSSTRKPCAAPASTPVATRRTWCPPHFGFTGLYRALLELCRTCIGFCNRSYSSKVAEKPAEPARRIKFTKAIHTAFQVVW